MKYLPMLLILVTPPCLGASDNDREVVITHVAQIHLNHVVRSDTNDFKQYIFWRLDEDGHPTKVLTYKMDDKVLSFPRRQVIDGKRVWVLDWTESRVHYRVIAKDFILDATNYDVEVDAREGHQFWRQRGLNRHFNGMVK